jgi:hypothetical protein
MLKVNMFVFMFAASLGLMGCKGAVAEKQTVNDLYKIDTSSEAIVGVAPSEMSSVEAVEEAVDVLFVTDSADLFFEKSEALNAFLSKLPSRVNYRFGVVLGLDYLRQSIETVERLSLVRNEIFERLSPLTESEVVLAERFFRSNAEKLIVLISGGTLQVMRSEN